MDIVEIEALFELPREELLLELASVGHDVFPRLPLRRAEEVYRSIRESLRDSICNDPRVVALQQEKGHTPELIAAIADIVAASTVGVPPFTVAVLILRDGLPKLCGSDQAGD
ncbi:MAG TPA: hypothetical protein VKC63_01060 [Solirubrobacterales bacterium]|nr:hypothetical protein [Solirubrobacterales bacterium]